jgi:putative glutathione S-transferase
MALGQLVNGQWSTQWAQRNPKSEFQRMYTQLHDQITTDGSSKFQAEPEHYHL